MSNPRVQQAIEALDAAAGALNQFLDTDLSQLSNAELIKVVRLQYELAEQVRAINANLMA